MVLRGRVELPWTVGPTGSGPAASAFVFAISGWRTELDSNQRRAQALSGLANRRHQPLGYPSDGVAGGPRTRGLLVGGQASFHLNHCDVIVPFGVPTPWLRGGTPRSQTWPTGFEAQLEHSAREAWSPLSDSNARTPVRSRLLYH